MTKKIAVLTCYMHQRGGDLVSAVSFMKSVLAHDPDVEFEWIVKRDISGFKKGRAELEAFKDTELGDLSDKVHVTCIDSSDYQNVRIQGDQVTDRSSGQRLGPQEFFQRSENNWGNVSTGWNGWSDVHTQLRATPIRDSDLIVVSATPHRLIQSDYQVLESYGKPIRLIPEYDLEHTNNKSYNSKTKIIHTGFGGSNSYRSYKDTTGLGVYIDETVMSSNGLDDTADADANFVNHLTGGELDDYKATHTLFYGYFFDIPTSVTSPVTTQTYITNSIMLAMDKKDEHTSIDIVIPGYKDPNALQQLYLAAINALPPQYKGKLATATYDLKQGDTFTSTSVTTGKGKYNVRLINPQRLERKTVQALLNESDPWVGLTGDASWVEGLMKGKIVCYQVVRWKEAFFNGFLTYMDQKLGDKSPLAQFYQAQRTGDFNTMRTLYIGSLPQMQHDAEQLAQHILSEKNLSDNIVQSLVNDGILTKKAKVSASKPVPPPPVQQLKSPAKTTTYQPPSSDGTGRKKSVDKTDEDTSPHSKKTSYKSANGGGNPTNDEELLAIFKLDILGHLKKTPPYGWFNWKSAHTPAKTTLSDVLENEDSSLNDVCDALVTYYQSVSRWELIGVGKTSNRHQKQFERYMMDIGVISSLKEKGDIIDKLKNLPNPNDDVFENLDLDVQKKPTSFDSNSV